MQCIRNKISVSQSSLETPCSDVNIHDIQNQQSRHLTWSWHLFKNESHNMASLNKEFKVSVMNCCWEKCDNNFCYGWTDRQMDRHTRVKQCTPLFFEQGVQLSFSSIKYSSIIFTATFFNFKQISMLQFYSTTPYKKNVYETWFLYMY